MKTYTFYHLKAAAKAISALENGSINTVYRWLLNETKAGRLPTYRIGKRRYVKLIEVILHIESTREGDSVESFDSVLSEGQHFPMLSKGDNLYAW